MASGIKVRHVILTGPPGVGKTTLVRKVCEVLGNDGVALQGFYTEEIRAQGRRTGFDVVTLDGNRGPLARVSQGDEHGRTYKVGQYTVNLMEFEQVALPTLRKKGKLGKLFVIDEIGKMELFSQSFIQSVRSVLGDQHTTCLATIPIPKGRPIPFVEEIRNRPDCKVYNVSKENRADILDDIINTVRASNQL